MTAQSIITKSNKSAYVTIGTNSLLFVSGSWHNRPFGSLGKYIIVKELNERDFAK